MAKAKRERTKGRRFLILRSFRRYSKPLAVSKLGVIVDANPSDWLTKNVLATHTPLFSKGQTFAILSEGWFAVSELKKLLKKSAKGPYLKELPRNKKEKRK